MALETYGGIEGQWNIPDNYSEEDKNVLRQRILLENQLNYQNLSEYSPLTSLLKDEYREEHGQEFTGDNRELVDNYAWEMTWIDDNEVSMFNLATEDRTDQQNYNLGLKMHIWERVHNRDWWKIAKDHIAASVTSPINIASVAITPFTFGAGGIWLKGGAFTAQQAAKQTMKQGLIGKVKNIVTGDIRKVIHKNVVKGVLAEGVLGGVAGGVHEFYKQDVEQEALRPETLTPFREEKNYESILFQSALVATTSMGITSGLYIGGKAVAAIIKKQMAQTVDQPFGRTPFEELRIVQPEKKTRINKLFGSGIVQTIKRGMTSSAGMPQPMADIVTNNMRKLTAMEEDINRTISDFDIIFKKEQGRDFSSLSEKEMLPYLELFLGDASKIGKLPIKLSDQLNLMRNKIANTSQYALDSGMIKDKALKLKMTENIKNRNHVNYSYRLHQSEVDWRVLVQTGVERHRYDEAKKFLNEFFENKKTDAEIKTILNDIIEKSASKQDILKQFTGRKDIPEEIRRLMGQNIDIRDVYKYTIGKIYASTAEYEYRTKFVDMGGDLGILTRQAGKSLNPLGKEVREFSLSREDLGKFLDDEVEVITNPFKGVFANDAFYSAFKKLNTETARLGEAQHIATAALAGANGLFSIGHTVYSPMTVSRNVTGGGIINLAAGNWINPIQKAMRKARIPLPKDKTGAWEMHDKEMTRVGKLFKRLSRSSNLEEEDLLLFREAIGYGVLQQGVRAEVLQRNLQDITNLHKQVYNIEKKISTTGKGIGWKTARQIKRKGYEVPMRFYGLMDDLNKLWAWDTEFRTFKAAYGNTEGKYFIPKRLALSSQYRGIDVPDLIRGGETSMTLGQYARASGDTVEVSEDILKAMAAKKSTTYYPTYDQTPPWIKEMRKIPFGNFVAFPSEMVRTTKNSVMNGLDEIYSGNRIMAARGMTRLASLTAVAGGMGGGVTGLTALGLSYISGKAEADLNPEEVDAFKSLNPWTLGGDYFFHSRQVKGDTSVIKATNMAYTDPFALFKEPLRVAMMAYQEGENLESAKQLFLSSLWKGAKEFIAPFAGTKRGYVPLLQLMVMEGSLDEQQKEKLWKQFHRTYMLRFIQEGTEFASNTLIPFIKGEEGREKTEWGSNVPSFWPDYVVGLAGGLKPAEHDLDLMASREIASLQREASSLKKTWTKYLKDIGKRDNLSLLPEILTEVRQRTDEEIDIHKKMWNVVKNLRTLGMSEQKIKDILTHHDALTKYKRLSGRKMSEPDADNFMHVEPLYFVKPDKIDEVAKHVDDPTYFAIRDVLEEYNRKILLNK